MNRKRLVTFGCSWTWGVGAHWTPADGDDKDLYDKYAWSYRADSMAARSLISDELNLNNINFARGGRSNQYNFRKAREYFTTPIKTDAVVLWGITSTARTEVFDIEKNGYQNIKFDIHGKDYPNLMDAYDHTNEVKILAENMLLWNDYFKFHNIPVIWYDTFNSHDYPHKIENLIPDDLLSTMLAINNIQYDTKWYHLSSWTNDDPRITKGIDNKLLNPISFHPSKLGQEKIASILMPYVKDVM